MPVSNLPHGHNYMRDFLYAGFRTAGHDVITYPYAPWLHLSSVEDRDTCSLDCDQTWPEDAERSASALAALTEKKFDVIVDVDNFTQPAAIGAVASNNRGTPVIAIDGTDSAKNLAPAAHSAWHGQVVKYFKRELPINATWAEPCPFTYPAERAAPPTDARDNKAIYMASTHNMNALARVAIARGIEALGATVFTSPGQSDRPTPEQCHAQMKTRLIGIHWNPTVWPVTDPDHQSGWDGNRFWENCAFGLVNVGHRPFIRFPPGADYTHGVNVMWADDPDGVIEIVRALSNDKDQALTLAHASYSHFRRYHTADARAQYVLQTSGFDV